MNTVNELVQNGINLGSAKQMIDSYKKRIGTMNGVYKITDITYDCVSKSKDVTLECSLCGKVIHRSLVKDKNKWSELKKTCECQKIARENAERELSEKNKAVKIELIKSRVGQTFGDYEIVSLDDLEDHPKYTMRCKECGAEKVVLADTFGKRTKFHCGKHYVQPCKYNESYIGQKKNHLEIIGLTRAGKDNHRAFLCRCDCGNIKAIGTADWERGLVKSCGCMHDELCKQGVTRHGFSGKRLYHVWRNMIDRCYNPKCKSYLNYGGRGIRICNDWLGDDGISNFSDWAYASGYDENAQRGECTIDRINVNGNYEPSNCRWISSAEQQKNKRPSSEWKKREPKRELDGVKRTMRSICEEYNISDPFIRYRMNVMHMTLSEAVHTDKFTMGRPRKENV